MVKVLIKGAGVGGLVCATHLIQYAQQNQYDLDLTMSAEGNSPRNTASWYAGGMLAPYCERESAEQIVEDLGVEAMDWWAETLPDLVQHNGTLVVAPARDHAELQRFATRTHQHQWLDATAIANLEPDLAGRFQKALFFAQERHIDPRQALLKLVDMLSNQNVDFVAPLNDETDFDYVIDCTGMTYTSQEPQLRGVRGEMLLVKTTEVQLKRPVRFLHPRIPLYIVPRDNHIFMIGATMIESDFDGAITARSMMEFLNAAYALHPAFGEAQIIEAGVGVRPAYRDNIPRMVQNGRLLSINGFYRHGYLLAPEMARQAVAAIFA